MAVAPAANSFVFVSRGMKLNFVPKQSTDDKNPASQLDQTRRFPL